MKKVLCILGTIAICLIFSGCEQPKNDSYSSDVGIDSSITPEEKSVPLNVAVDGMSAELNDLKSNSPANIDWSNAAIGCPLQGISECYALKLTNDYEAHPEKVLTVEEQLEQFESYCKSYLGEYNSEFACFKTIKRGLGGDKYTIDGIEDVVFTDFPKIDEYKDKILNGEIEPIWYLYVEHERQMYLWWSAASMIYPHWYNKGKTLQMLDKYFKASSTIPTDIGEPVAVFSNDGSHNNETYHLLSGDVSIGEAVDWFTNEYTKSLGVFPDEDIPKPAVRQIEVYQITADTYAYVFLFTFTLGGIPCDYTGERYLVGSNENSYSSVSTGGQALMINKNEIDMAYDIAPSMYVTEGEPITEIISLHEAAGILGKSVSESVLYKAKTVELVMTGNRTEDNPEPLLMPTWKITLQNDNDGFLYDFYIDAVSGALGYVRYKSNI